MTTEFAHHPWPKIARLANEKVTVTEKIDGTNAAVVILPDGAFYTQSRSRVLSLESDNFGFAKWAHANEETLRADLGFGVHHGEWWGSGIQRGYGLEKGEKRFSVFNAARWTQAFEEGHTFSTPGLGVVPLLYHGPFDKVNVQDIVQDLYYFGSYVDVPVRFKHPEGVVVYLHEAKVSYKITDAAVGTKERYASE